MSALNNSLLLGQEGGGGYAISRSLRFNSADSAYLSRVFTSTGNRRTWTLSTWVKRSKLGTTQNIFQSSNESTADEYLVLNFDSSDRLFMGGGPTTYRLSSARFRDVSAWYHILLQWDTTQATASNRVRLYVNGSQLTTFDSSSDPSQNFDGGINRAKRHSFGVEDFSSGVNFLDAYLADAFFIDGQALDPTSFGEFDDNGIWQPIAYTGTYSGNSFHLDFADNSTTAALGTDTSGNGNDWTVNNIAVGDGLVYSLYVAGTTTTGYPKANMFDGSTATTGAVTNAGGFTWTPPGGISYSSGVEVFVNASIGAGTQGYIVNGGTQQNINADGSWQSIATGSGTLTTLVINNAGLGNNNLWLSGIRINGTTILTDGAGAGNDSLVDVPTNGSEVDTGSGGQVRGNYCTWNPVGSGSGATLTNGNLDYSLSGATVAIRQARGTFLIPTAGKWYWEHTVATVGETQIGVVDFQTGLSSNYYWYDVGGWQNIYINDVQVASVVGYTNGDVIGVGYDADNNQIRWYKNGTQVGTNYSLTNTGRFVPFVLHGSVSGSCSGSANFGQRPFAYTAPSGFKALNTASLPSPLVTKPSTVMDVKLYSGNNSTQTIPLDFNPDFIWLKCRNSGRSHRLIDSVRGLEYQLFSDTTDGGNTYDATSYRSSVTSTSSSGFVVDNSASIDQYNTSGETYAAWCWDAGSSTVTNTQGSISSQVRANASAGFSIVTFSMLSGTYTVGHGLNVAPSLLITKGRTSTSNWWVYHVSLGSSQYLGLNSTAAASSLSWGSSPTSSVFTANNNFFSNGQDYVVYAFAPVAGYSSFGSYTGNGSSDGPFVFCNFRPRWVLLKLSSSAGGDWALYDTSRGPYNLNTPKISPDSSAIEDDTTLWGGSPSSYGLDFLSNGFKLRNTAGGSHNGTGFTYIYAAFAESCFALNARAR